MSRMNERPPQLWSSYARLIVLSIALVMTSAPRGGAAAHDFASSATPLKQFCFDCHNTATAEAQVNLEQMMARPAFDTTFKKWEKVAAMLESGRMPPQDVAQPTVDQQRQLVRLVREELRRASEA